MQKWEYLLVEASPYPFGDKLINIYINGKERREWKDRTLYELVNHLGNEGWELVTFSHNSKSDDNYLIFKRPKTTI
ncbi:MAG: hypothetical protein F6K22_16490 [Okeania sp. SIO2F4]|uniref:hypothetical protein n=1 Tax=Okeania sp. SIO2F4 TaxID=2607790 RepID=UPI001429CA8C|nr:hypothetical protein [Okeania sp. SIO2F4]NES04286.1 hypothetical protein [Okeania sp. SIO2F4]